MSPNPPNGPVGDTRRGAHTREHIIEQAAELLNQKGYVGASISDVMEATGLKKGGIYRHFESKEQLALEAFDHATRVMSERYERAVREADTAPDQLRAIVSVFRSLATDPPIAGGCPVINTAVEADDGNPALRRRARRAMDWLHRLVRTTAENGVDRGELDASIEPERLASVLISTLEGGVVLSRLYGDAVHVDRAADHLHAWIAAHST